MFFLSLFCPVCYLKFYLPCLSVIQTKATAINLSVSCLFVFIKQLDFISTVWKKTATHMCLCADNLPKRWAKGDCTFDRICFCRTLREFLLLCVSVTAHWSDQITLYLPSSRIRDLLGPGGSGKAIANHHGTDFLSVPRWSCDWWEF